MSIFPFVPSPVAAQSFVTRLDDQNITIVVTWNISGQRWYINLYDSVGNWICTVPIMETSPGKALASLVYNNNQKAIIATLSVPKWRPIGQIIQYTIVGCTPDILNNTYDCLTINETTFSFPVSADPGIISVLGSVHCYDNLVEGYFQNSVLIFRNAAFEIYP